MALGRSSRWSGTLNILLIAIAAIGPIVFLALLLSPWLVDQLSQRFEDHVQVRAEVISCAPERLGKTHENAVRCRFRYAFEGKAYEAEAAGWTSRRAFMTSDQLDRTTAAQSATTHRVAYLDPDTPSHAWLADRRLLEMPPLWLWLLALFVLLGIVGVRLDPSAIPWRRAELTTDPATGHLVAIDDRRCRRVRRRILVQVAAALAAIVICLFGLSNRPAELAGRLGMTELSPVPAKLVDCTHRYHGVRRGNDQIECGFDYHVGGQLFRGEAEALDFRLFPTRARMDAQVARIAASPFVTAHVDPRHPTYAWAAISTDRMVPFTWGIFDLQLWVIVILLAGFMMMSVVRWRRAGDGDWLPGSRVEGSASRL